MIKSVIQPPDPRLRKKSKQVKKIDKKIKDLIQDMKDTLNAQRDPEGVGLAAPQIGKNLRIFLMKFSEDDAKEHGEIDRSKIVINPKILSQSRVKKSAIKKKKQILEGCLSLPHFYGPLTRSKKVELEYTNEEGEVVKQIFTGFPAQIVLHEVDHLDGVLFVDRLLEQKQKLYEFRNDEWHEVHL